MPEYDALEREVVDYYKRMYLMKAGENPEREIYKHMVEHKYGKGARDPLITVDWGKVFQENKCPACNSLISLSSQGYVCDKCDYMIPLNLYDRAIEQQKKRAKLMEEGRKTREKAQAAGYTQRRLTLLEEAAIDEVMDELEITENRQRIKEEKKQHQLGGKKQLGGGRKGVTIKKKWGKR